MKKFRKRLSAVLLAMAMVLTLAPAVQAADKVEVPTSQTIYRTSSSGTNYVSIYVSGLAKSQKITKSSVKSSNKSVAEIESLSHYAHSSTYNYAYFNGTKDTKDTYNSYSASIGLSLKKAGTATVSFKIGSKTYKSKVVVKKYVNPVKSLTITGVNGGKNLASAFKSSNSASGKLKKTTKNVWIKAKAASGWKVQSISCSNRQNYNSNSFGGYSNPVSSAVVGVGTLTGGKTYSVSVTMVNTSNKGTITVDYQLN